MKPIWQASRSITAGAAHQTYRMLDDFIQDAFNKKPDARRPDGKTLKTGINPAQVKNLGRKICGSSHVSCWAHRGCLLRFHGERAELPEQADPRDRLDRGRQRHRRDHARRHGGAANRLNAVIAWLAFARYRERSAGAAGILGGKNCAQAAPDGYNICVRHLSFDAVVQPGLLFCNLPYNAETDFVPIARLFFLVEGLFASSEINVKTVAEAKALAQSKPDGLNYATLGEGSPP